MTQIDPASITLETVSPLRWALEDVGTPFEPYTDKPLDRMACNTLRRDGFMDLTLKFDNQAVSAVLAPVVDREVRVLRLEGKLKEEFGGKRIVGEDVIVILTK